MTALAAVAIAAVVAVGASWYLGKDAPAPTTPSQTTSATPAVPEARPSIAVKPTPLPDTPAILPQAILGRDDAPVTMLEFSSLTCGHCGNFHRETLPQIKKDYIDTGKLRLVFRDFPLDQLALAASMLPHCAGQERYFGFLEVLFRTQETWAGGKDPLGELKKVARLGGMSANDFEACLGNQPLFAAIRDRAAADGKAYAIEATPTFRIGDQTIVGGQPFDAFKKLIDEALKASK